MKTLNAMVVSLTALLMAGCSQNEVTEVNLDTHSPMTFGVYTATSTRGVDTDNNSIKADPDGASYGGFGVMGYFTGSEKWVDAKATTAPGFMHNQMVKWDEKLNDGSGAWTYSPIKYWPNNENDKISFFAYAPYEKECDKGTKTGVITSGPTDKGAPFIKFTLKEKDDLPNMVDLLFASETDRRYIDAKGDKINFEFKHTLSRVSFKAKLGSGNFTGMDGDESFVYITEMWIVGKSHGNTVTDGNLSLLDPNAPSNANSKFYTTATWKESHWDYEGAVIPTKDFSLKSMLATDAGITETNPIKGHDGTITGVKLTNAAQTTPVSLFRDKQYLYLIPVGDTEVLADSKGCGAEDIQIGFHYDIVSKDNANSNQYIASHAESVVKLPAGHLKRQTTYQYTLIINPHAIVIGEVKVDGWGNETTGDLQ